MGKTDDIRKIVILGGSGFIGSHLVSLLIDDGYDIKIGDIKKSKQYPNLWEYCDICQKKDLRKTCNGYDVIINLAAEHHDNIIPVSLYYKVNVEGSQNVCDVASELGIKRILFTSSVAVYGFSKLEIDENYQHNPFSEYGKTKSEAEKLYIRWCNQKTENSLVILRPTAVFGKNNRANIYSLCRQINNNKFILVGNGKNIKAFAYVDNLTAFIEYSLKKCVTGINIFNYIDKPDIDMNTLVKYIDEFNNRKRIITIKLPYWLGFLIGLIFDIIANITRKKFILSRVRVKKLFVQTLFSSQKMLDTGFLPPYSIRNGLLKTLECEFGNNE